MKKTIKLTVSELLELEKSVERLHEQFGLGEETLEEIKYKIALVFKDAED